ncbi:MAG TPA: hypothetical protein VIY86_07850, partial [Pirellulaceae bacterium]
LGAPEYQAREQAESELRKLGLEVFELLHEAEGHPDLEIKLRARAMLHDLRGRYVLRDLSPGLQRLLADYEDLESNERLFLLGRIALLLPQEGVDAMTRLARFEREELIAKFAAGRLMLASLPKDPVRRAEIGTMISQNLGTSDRTSVQWLRLFSRALMDPHQVGSQWEAVIGHETGLATDERRGAASVAFARHLRIAYAEALLAADRAPDAQRWIQEVSDQRDMDEEERFDWLVWLVDHQQWDALDRFAAPFAAAATSSKALYMLAESYDRRGRASDARATMEKAVEVPGPLSSRKELADWLYNERGQYAWAEAEYRRAMGDPTGEAVVYLSAAQDFAAMLHDLERDREAAEVLQEVAQRSQDDEPVRTAWEQSPLAKKRMLTLVHLYQAEEHRRQGEATPQRELLQKAFDNDPSDIETLIAMYNVEGAPAEWRETTSNRIRAACQAFELKIRQLQAEVEIASLEDALRGRFELANVCNEFAWLVSNTEGDFARAVQFSRLSLDCAPGTEAYMDTLGRCYYAQGDVAQAIHFQQMASERAPYAQQIQRQLALFLKARDDAPPHGS